MRLNIILFKKNVMDSIGELTKKYANLPEAYIKKSLERIEWKTPRGLPQYLPKTISQKVKYIGQHRPWTSAYWREVEGRGKPKIWVEPIRDWPIFRGDRVEILVGRDKGKQGIVTQIIQERNWVFVEGLNVKLKLAAKTKEFPGSVIANEEPLLVTTEVKLVDPSDLQAVDIEWRYTEEGKKVRVSKRTGRIIPIPRMAEETYDYKTKSSYKESEKDTTNKELTKITFQPKLCTFEMDIMKSMEIKETRIPGKTYWY